MYMSTNRWRKPEANQIKKYGVNNVYFHYLFFSLEISENHLQINYWTEFVDRYLLCNAMYYMHFSNILTLVCFPVKMCLEYVNCCCWFFFPVCSPVLVLFLAYCVSQHCDTVNLSPWTLLRAVVLFITSAILTLAPWFTDGPFNPGVKEHSDDHVARSQIS